MKIYRITRYTPSGKRLWQRLYSHTAGWPGTVGCLVDHGMTGKDYATLEVAEIDESLFRMLRCRKADE